MSASLARLAVLNTLIDVAEQAPTVDAAVSAAEVARVLGVRVATANKALARLVAEGAALMVGGRYRYSAPIGCPKPIPRPPKKVRPVAGPVQTLRERLLNVSAGREDRTTIKFLLGTLKDPLSQREAAELLTRLEKR